MKDAYQMESVDIYVYFVGNVIHDDTPRMVLITFTGVVDDDFLKIHSAIFPKNPSKNRRNPNGCPMVSTIFVRGERTNYCAVNKLWAYNHEIGLNGKLQRTEQYWLDAELGTIAKDISSLRDTLIKKSKIPVEDIIGSRTPFYVGNKNYYVTLEEYGFEYDSSIIVGRIDDEQDIEAPAIFPYTMGNVIGTKDDDPSAKYKCAGGRPDLCPKDEFEYLWQVPVLYSYLESKDKCKDLALCTNATELGEIGIFEFLRRNFERHESTRIPYMINLDIQHMKLQSDKYIEGLNLFLETLAEKDDTWVITIHQTLEWMKDPTSLVDIEGLSAWGCQTHIMDDCNIAGMDESDDENKTKTVKPKKTIQGLFPDGRNLVYGQTVVLVVLFAIVYKYDQWKLKKKK